MEYNLPAERGIVGMDHPHYEWNPITIRPSIKWPNGDRVALTVVVNLECIELKPPSGSYHLPTLYSSGVPDYRNMSHRDYGHRVGIFRVLDVLEKYGIKPTVALDAITITNYPWLVKYISERDCEIIAHGISLSQIISSRMPEKVERAYIKETIDVIEKGFGFRPKGWLGTEYGESSITPRLLAESGIEYLCDWVNDEQPYLMTTPVGKLFSLPLLLDLDDQFALKDRGFEVDTYAEMIRMAFDRIYDDSSASGRLLVLHIHPWIIGQPFRIGYFEEALDHIVSRDSVWKASGDEVINWYSQISVSKTN